MYESIRERVAQIIGQASMLWTETPTGTFKSEKAKELVDEIMTHIQYPLHHPDDEEIAKEAFKRGYIANGIKELKKTDIMNTALNDSKRFRVNEEEIYKNDMCTCQHERKDHRKSAILNSTQLGCGLCECRWFKMSACQSNNSL